jgi:hypothetical protein
MQTSLAIAANPNGAQGVAGSNPAVPIVDAIERKGFSSRRFGL